MSELDTSGTASVQDTPAPESAEPIESVDTGTPDPSTGEVETDSQPDDTIDVEVDGTSQRVKSEEGRLGYMRDADYRQKTMALAERERTVVARQEKLNSIVEQGDALVQALSEEFQSEFAGVNWGELAANDPAEYVRKQHAASQRQAKLQAALYRLNEAKQVQNTASQESITARVKEEQALLVERLPEWKDATRYKAESAQISEYLTTSGYGPEEVSGVTDHRAVILARKAMLYDKLMAKTPKPSAVPGAPTPIPKAPTKATGEKAVKDMTDKEFAAFRQRQIAQRR